VLLLLLLLVLELLLDITAMLVAADTGMAQRSNPRCSCQCTAGASGDICMEL
jgi:hypothetical protein